MSASVPLSFPQSNLSTKDEIPLTTFHPGPTISKVPGSSSRDLPRLSRPSLLPVTRQDARDQITCCDRLGNPKKHEAEQRYVSPTTGACRKLVVQSVNPNGPGEKHIKDHVDNASKLALWLCSTNPFRGRMFFKWIAKWIFFSLKLLWPFIWIYIQFHLNFVADSGEDSMPYNTGNYKSYVRPFRRQFWAARSPKEHSTRTKDTNEEKLPTHSLYPRLLMIREPTRDRWSPCTDPITITHTKFVAISYCPADMYTHGPDQEREKDFIQEVRTAVVQQDFDAYWLDLECLSKNPHEKKLDVYCMADVYRRAEITLIMLDSQSDDAWKRWGARVWTLLEALLSRRLYYKSRGQSEIQPISLHQLGNLAYTKYDSEQAIINAYSGEDPLEKLERLRLLKSAIWRRGVTIPSPEPIPSTSAPFPSPDLDLSARKAPDTSVPFAADSVYALMGFFDHRIEPDHSEDNFRALARLFMANNKNLIVERMVSLLPSTIRQTAGWYADDDVYSANLWDVLPEIQTAGITENGALVLDGCKAACIRWKDFPTVAFKKSDSMRRTLIYILCYLAWPSIIVGSAVWATTKTGGIILVACGSLILLLSPWLFVFSEGSRVFDAQPWLIGVKGVLHVDKAVVHLYGGAVKGRYRSLDYTPSGSEFAVPEQGLHRGGSRTQYDNAMKAEHGSQARRTYTLIDTYSSTIYYFCADRPPTVCLFTGREGGMGRFVLCSERCGDDELHKETVLRMPTYISQRMELCGWVALG